MSAKQAMIDNEELRLLEEKAKHLPPEIRQVLTMMEKVQKESHEISEGAKHLGGILQVCSNIAVGLNILSVPLCFVYGPWFILLTAVSAALAVFLAYIGANYQAISVRENAKMRLAIKACLHILECESMGESRFKPATELFVKLLEVNSD